MVISQSKQENKSHRGKNLMLIIRETIFDDNLFEKKLHAADQNEDSHRCSIPIVNVTKNN